MSGKPFEIGLCGAGAISAGAYTAGVIDFTIQALDAWYAAKQADDTDAPPHDVRLSVFSGSSAGGITAALAAGYLASDQPPIATKADGDANHGRNKLFDSWVERISIESLLTSRDLADPAARVVSVLDSTVLADIADSGLDVTPRDRVRPYLADDFHVLLTVTNLRGVPYAIQLEGGVDAPHQMSLHADHVHFAFNESGRVDKADMVAIPWQGFGGDHDGIAMLKLAALASGAFPVGLAPRTLAQVLREPGRHDIYSSREWPIPTDRTEEGGIKRCQRWLSIPAAWGALDDDYRYNFICVDGGVMNNEPLELARRNLAGTTRNPRNGMEAEKAVLLIDPFPSGSLFSRKYSPRRPDIVGQLLPLFNALKNQTRFKPDELVLAMEEHNYSRFLIAPKRSGQAHPIACGSLGGFGGFLKRDFREHDFFLGRRNAQKFLRDSFVLPERNPLFNDWTAEQRERFLVRNADGAAMTRTVAHLGDSTTQRMLPIIPMVGNAAVTCEALPWPRYTFQDLDLLAGQVDDRFSKVLDRLVEHYFRTNNLLLRFGAKFLLGRKRRDLVGFTKKQVEDDLRRMHLLG